MKLKLCNNGLSVYGTNEQGQCVSYSIEAEEYKQWLSEGNTPEPEFTEEELREQELAKQVNEAKAFLDKTDKKVLPDYEFKEGDNTLEWYMEERSKARAFIRANEIA